MLEWLHQLHTPEGISSIIAAGGLMVLTFIIFAETGLLIGFFLPGDSLLITAGVLANPLNANHIAALDVVTMNIVLIVAAIVGDQVGFYLGHKVGDRIWEKQDGKLYKKAHLVEAHDFYVKYGGPSVVAARFVPILRTFVPFVAGVARMPYKRFVIWNILGGVVWITSMLWLGYFLGQTSYANRLDKLIVLVIMVSVLPLVIGAVKRTFFSKGKRHQGA